MGVSIGIDFGTTKTLVSYFDEASHTVKLARLGREGDSIPSTFHVDSKGQRSFGDNADDYIELDPAGYARAFKLFLGENEPFLSRETENGVVSLTAEEITTEFLRLVKIRCELGVFGKVDCVDAATITIPVSFTPARSAALKRAAEKAGFANVTLLPEPAAAGIAFFRENPTEKCNRVIIIDWGGGTVDIAVVSRRSDGTVAPESGTYVGDDTIGGEEIDRLLWNSEVGRFAEKYKQDINSPVEQVPRRLRLLRRCKEKLSEAEYVTFSPVTLLGLPILKSVLAKVVEPLATHVCDLLNEVLRRASALDGGSPSDLVLIGGTSRIEVIQDVIKSQFPNLKVHTWGRANEAVACGATELSEKRFVADKEDFNNSPNQSVKEFEEFGDPRMTKDAPFQSNDMLMNDKPPTRPYDVVKAEAENNSPLAQYELGLLFLHGVGVSISPQDAFYWFHKAADSEDSNGEYELGRCFHHGIGVEQNVYLARQYYISAAQHGCNQALMAVTDLDRSYHNAKGVSIQDIENTLLGLENTRIWVGRAMPLEVREIAWKRILYRRSPKSQILAVISSAYPSYYIVLTSEGMFFDKQMFPWSIADCFHVRSSDVVVLIDRNNTELYKIDHMVLYSIGEYNKRYSALIDFFGRLKTLRCETGAFHENFRAKVGFAKVIRRIFKGYISPRFRIIPNIPAQWISKAGETTVAMFDTTTVFHNAGRHIALGYYGIKVKGIATAFNANWTDIFGIYAGSGAEITWKSYELSNFVKHTAYLIEEDEKMCRDAKKRICRIVDEAHYQMFNGHEFSICDSNSPDSKHHTSMRFKISERCDGCTHYAFSPSCVKQCPISAISGTKGLRHHIDQAKCIKCGKCAAACYVFAIIEE